MEEWIEAVEVGESGGEAEEADGVDGGDVDADDFGWGEVEGGGDFC